MRHFSPGFLDREPEGIYDVLMAQLISAANGYDRHYKEKLKEGVEVIYSELSKQKQFSSALINRHLEFDCTRHLRLLVRLGFLETLPGRGTEKKDATD